MTIASQRMRRKRTRANFGQKAGPREHKQSRSVALRLKPLNLICRREFDGDFFQAREGDSGTIGGEIIDSTSISNEKITRSINSK